MELITLIYLLLGGIMFFSLFIVLLVIAGKDILFSFYRRFSQKGADVFIINPSRNIQQYFKKSIDGIFRIDKKLYITNPNKLENLSPEMVKQVKQSMDLKIKTLKSNIDKRRLKKDIIVKQIQTIDENDPNAFIIIEGLKLQVEELNTQIATLKSKLTERENSYFFRKRPVYFYIEGDPVPKDFYELYTEMDSVIIENIISRAQTKDPKSIANMEKELLFLKKMVIIAVIVGAIAGFLAFRNNNVLTQLAQNMGVTLSV